MGAAVISLRGSGTCCNIFPSVNWVVLVFGIVAMLVLIAGDYLLKGLPVSLVVVVAAILVMSFTNLASAGVHITGIIPEGLPSISRPVSPFQGRGWRAGTGICLFPDGIYRDHFRSQNIGA